MLYILAILIVITLIFTIIRAGSTALEMTGLSRDVAKFQSLSAFFGVGFTTHEAELVVKHPVRRRIIRDLIIVGNIGIMSVLGTVVVTAGKLDFANDPTTSWIKICVIVGGLLSLWGISKTPIPTWLIDRSVNRMLDNSGMLQAMDYDELLRVHSGYAIEEFHVHADNPLVGRMIKDIRPRESGINVLGIARLDGSYVGTPRGSTVFEIDDVLVLYGEHSAVAELLGGAPVTPKAERSRQTHRRYS